MKRGWIVFQIGLPVLLLAAAMLSQVTSAQNAICFDHPDPLNRNKIQRISCSQQAELSLDARKQFTLLSSGKSATGGLQIALTCPGVNSIVCKSAQKGFDLAKSLIEDMLVLPQPVLISATFTSFCTAYGKCGGLIIGQAGPKRSFAVMDTDKTTRLYPQSLVKQFQLPGQVTFDAYDIEAVFNSDVSWWFADNTSTASNSQTTSNKEDFVGTTVHEIVHGLGFLSTWNDYFGQLLPGKQITSLQPYISLGAQSDGKYTFEGFLALAMDRLIVEKSTGKGVSERVAAMNQFTLPPTAASSWTEFFTTLITKFEASPQYTYATDMLKISTGSMWSLAIPNIGTAGELITVSNSQTTADDGNFWLETSLTPFAPGSSISHSSIHYFAYSSDFLMCYRDSGISTYLKRVADSNSPTNNPIGPRLLRVLELMGYATYRTPTPLYKPTGYAESSGVAVDGSSSNKASGAGSPHCCLWQALVFVAASAGLFG